MFHAEIMFQVFESKHPLRFKTTERLTCPMSGERMTRRRFFPAWSNLVFESPTLRPTARYLLVLLVRFLQPHGAKSRAPCPSPCSSPSVSPQTLSAICSEASKLLSAFVWLFLRVRKCTHLPGLASPNFLRFHQTCPEFLGGG